MTLIKRSQLTFLLIALVLVIALLTPMAMLPDGRHVFQVGGLFNHPTIAESSLSAGYTFFELSARRNAGLTYVVDPWISPREGKVVLSKPEGRWHRSQAVRRML